MLKIQLSDFLWLTPFFCFLLGYQLLNLLVNPSDFPAPNVVGMSMDHTIAVLSDHNVNARVAAYKQEADLPVGTIVSQSPAAGTRIKTNQPIFLVVSAQPPKPVAPAVVNQHIDKISSVLHNTNIRFKTYHLPSAKPSGIVIAQSPPAEHIVDQSMTVYVSSGNNKPVIFPQLKGQPVTEVRELLERAHLSPHIIHTRVVPEHHTCTRCTVVDQKPLAGSLVDLSQQKTVLLHVR